MSKRFPFRTAIAGLTALAMAAPTIAPVNTTVLSAAIAQAQEKLQVSGADFVDYKTEQEFTATVPGATTGTVQFYLDGVKQGSPVALTNGNATAKITPVSYGEHTVTARYITKQGDKDVHPNPDGEKTFTTALPNADIVVGTDRDSYNAGEFVDGYAGGLATSTSTGTADNPKILKPGDYFTVRGQMTVGAARRIYETGLNPTGNTTFVKTQEHNSGQFSTVTVGQPNGTSTTTGRNLTVPQWGQGTVPKVNPAYRGQHKTAFGTSYSQSSGDTFKYAVQYQAPREPGLYVTQFASWKDDKTHVLHRLDNTFFRIQPEEIPARTLPEANQGTAQQPSLTVAANQATVTEGTESTLTATVTPDTAEGTVQFKNNGTNIGQPVTVTDGTAQLPHTLPVGTNTITAEFTPANTTEFTTATAQATTVTVNPIKVDTTIAYTGNTTHPYGDTKHLMEATVTADGQPVTGGKVEFTLDGTVLSPQIDVANGKAVYDKTFNQPGQEGNHTLTLRYIPAANSKYNPSTTAEPATFTITKATQPSLTVAADQATVTEGTESTLTATVTPDTAEGTVQFKNNGTNIGQPVTVTDGTAQLPHTLPVGTNTITAEFTPANTTEFTTATAQATTVTVTEKEDDNQQPPAPEATAPTVTVTAPTGETTTEDEVTLTAKVDPASAGSVEFFNGDTKLPGTVTYNPSTGEATLTTTLPAGDYTITAKFTPADDNTTAKAATSTAATFTVTEKEDDNQQPPAPEATAPTVTVTAPTGETTTEDEVTLTAKVDPASAGSVEFFNGDTKLPGTVNYNPSTGEATLTTTLPAGDYTVTAKFTPAADNTTAKASTSDAAAKFTVTKKHDDNQQPPAPNTPQSVEIAANGQEKVTVQDGNTTVKFSVKAAPGQSVTFKLSDGTKLGDVKADANGVATLVHDFKKAGTYTVTATAQDAPMPNDDGSSLAVEGKGVLAGTIIGAVLSLIVAIGSQTHIPGINNAITNMQRQLGIHNPQLAGQVERALPAVGALTGIAGLATAIGLLVKAIKDGDVKFEIKTDGNGGAGSSAKAPKNG